MAKKAAKKASKKAAKRTVKKAAGKKTAKRPHRPEKPVVSFSKEDNKAIKKLLPKDKDLMEGRKRLLRESRWPKCPRKGQLLLLVMIYGPNEDLEPKKQKENRKKNRKGKK